MFKLECPTGIGKVSNKLSKVIVDLFDIDPSVNNNVYSVNVSSAQKSIQPCAEARKKVFQNYTKLKYG